MALAASSSTITQSNILRFTWFWFQTRASRPELDKEKKKFARRGGEPGERKKKCVCCETPHLAMMGGGQMAVHAGPARKASAVEDDGRCHNWLSGVVYNSRVHHLPPAEESQRAESPEAYVGTRSDAPPYQPLHRRCTLLTGGSVAACGPAGVPMESPGRLGRRKVAGGGLRDERHGRRTTVELSAATPRAVCRWPHARSAGRLASAAALSSLHPLLLVDPASQGSDDSKHPMAAVKEGRRASLH
jgi:hypothetical protein